MVDYNYDGPPKPHKNKRCSRKCPYHNTDYMPGWPMFEECLKWDEKKHGKEPYYLNNSAICMPSFDEKK